MNGPGRVRRTRRICVLLLLLLLPFAARAHVGSKDVFQTVHAGPYTLNVVIRPPEVIPGVAMVEVHAELGPSISGLSITPLPLTGEASLHPPSPDSMQRDAADPNLFTGGVWMMASGAWQVRFDLQGAGGAQRASVPVLAVPVSTLRMQRGLGLALAALGLFLVVSMAGIVGASVREARLRPGVVPTPGLRRRSVVALSVSLAIMLGAVSLGGLWWHAEAASYAENVYTRPMTSATLTGDTLDLRVAVFDPHPEQKLRWSRARGNDDYIPDHGRLIHLYAIRQPGMDAVFHLHPTLAAPGDFRLQLPSMPPGRYQLYGDVVHRNGFPETLTASVDVPAGLHGTALAADDAEATPAPLSAGMLGPVYRLPDGYTMVWSPPATLTAQTPYTFRFELRDPAGHPASDMQPYLGMAGHAAFVKTDGTVFAHTHPEGSAAMADVMLASPMEGMAEAGPIAPQVGFPYGFPSRGRYRIFVQMKHGSTVETGAFDAEVR